MFFKQKLNVLKGWLISIFYIENEEKINADNKKYKWYVLKRETYLNQGGLVSLNDKGRWFIKYISFVMIVWYIFFIGTSQSWEN